jgi:hypothetical protein
LVNVKWLDSGLMMKVGLSGGIIQVSASCKTNELQNGMGVTVYHFVDSIDEVSCISFSFASKSTRREKTNRKRPRNESRSWEDQPAVIRKRRVTMACGCISRI